MYGYEIFRFPKIKSMGLPYYFTLVNCAAFVGLWKGLKGSETVLWKRTRR